MSERAPAFELPSDAGTSFSLKSAKGKYLVLYFYPKDDTPGCTREAQAFTALARAFEQRGALVVGVSRDSAERHQKFRAKYDLDLILVSDVDSKVHQAYGAYGEKKLYGKISTGALRTTVLIDPDGKIVKRWSNVKVDGHADAVLAELDAARGGAPIAKAPAAKKAAPAKKAASPAKNAKKSAPAKKASAAKTVKKR